MGWYGLTKNGSLLAVQWFNERPQVSDFAMGYCSYSKYEIVEVEVKIV